MRKTILKSLMIAALLGAPLAAPAFAADWGKEVMTVIAKNQNYPRSAQVRNEQGTTKIRVLFDGSGKVTGTEIVEGSGSDILDRESQKIFEKTGTLPAPPSGTTKLVVPIVWRLS